MFPFMDVYGTVAAFDLTSRVGGHQLFVKLELIGMRVRWLCRKIPRRQITAIVGEFGYMGADGMTPAQSLLAGTSVAATLLGLSERIGALRPGVTADLLGVPSNPLDDIEVTQSL